jgi:hypothetical protein
MLREGCWHVSLTLFQLTVNPRRSPGGIRNVQLPDEFSDFSSGIGSSWVTTLPPPIETKALTMPTKDGFWADDPQG